MLQHGIRDTATINDLHQISIDFWKTREVDGQK